MVTRRPANWRYAFNPVGLSAKRTVTRPPLLRVALTPGVVVEGSAAAAATARTERASIARHVLPERERERRQAGGERQPDDVVAVGAAPGERVQALGAHGDAPRRPAVDAHGQRPAAAEHEVDAPGAHVRGQRRVADRGRVLEAHLPRAAEREPAQPE